MKRKRLENWFVSSEPNPYLAPELRVPKLTGEIYNHPNHTNGKVVTVSTPVGKTKSGLVRTKNSTYKLGKPADKYEEMFPGAAERFINSLPQLV